MQMYYRAILYAANKAHGGHPLDATVARRCGHLHTSPKAAQRCARRNGAGWTVESTFQLNAREQRQARREMRTYNALTRSYWVEPFKLLAGCYPGGHNAVEMRMKLDVLTGAGIGAYVNLMEPGEVNFAGKSFSPYAPMASAMAHDLGRGVRFHSCPIRDRAVPLYCEMQRTLDVIDAELSRDVRVYVHCWGGLGRTGLVVACWLMRHGYAANADEAMALIAEWRYYLPTGYLPSPETIEQRDFLLRWEQGEQRALYLEEVSLHADLL
ncbi:MAG: hypothetical protein BWY76_02683 [bacterium ADurb.Bin429]|nr:MAG: hypothetical protein BWY76_02683 [bacterium ADurb.Bin429]